jgi:hypothetical protein
MSSRLILLGRILLLLIAAGAVVAAFVVTRREDRAAGEPGGRYVCPMHPEVTSSVPGDKCPICRMDLELMSAADANANAPSAAFSPLNAQYFDIPRKRAFAHDVRAPAWVEAAGGVAAILYDDELATLGWEERVAFTASDMPHERVPIHLEPGPPTPWDRSTSRVSFRVDGAAPRALRPGEVGWVRLSGKRRELLAIPSSALLEAAEGPYVLVGSPDGWMLSKRPVEVGRVFGGMAFILSGLRPQDRVLLRNAFFHDAERRLHQSSAITMEATPPNPRSGLIEVTP